MPFIQIADTVGVWGISFLLVYPSALLGAAFADGLAALREQWRRLFAPAAVYAVLFAGVIVYGFAAQVDLRDAKPWRVALVQQNVDPWKGGYTAYRDSLDALLRQSELALQDNPQIVIWSETSFVPAIDWHTRYRPDNQTYQLVLELQAVPGVPIGPVRRGKR